MILAILKKTKWALTWLISQGLETVAASILNCREKSAIHDRCE